MQTSAYFTELSDEALMDKLKSGESTALNVIMERWEVPVKAFIVRLGAKYPDAEDLAQNTFVRLYERRSYYRSGAPFKSWLLTIAANLTRNHFRWHARHPAQTLEFQHDIIDDFPVEPSNIDTELLRTRLTVAIGKLPAKLREALVLIDIEELSYQAAANIMSCSTKAAENRIRRARSALHLMLKDLVGFSV